jgi:hypothetical protein
VSQVDPARLRAELGMPETAKPQVFTFPGTNWGAEWREYDVEMVALRVASHGPWPGFAIETENGSIFGQAWRTRVHCQGSPAFLERRWHPKTGQLRLGIFGFEQASQDAIIATRRGQQLLLEATSPAGRKKRTGPPEELQRLPQLYWRYAEQYKKLPEKAEMARELGISPRTFYRWDKEGWVDWPPADVYSSV